MRPIILKYSNELTKQEYKNEQWPIKIWYGGEKLSTLYWENGMYQLYYRTGQLLEVGYYNKDGPFRIYYRNGKLLMEGSKKAGKKNGAYKTYYSNGILEVEGVYKNGKTDGLYKKYDEQGVLQEERIFIDNKLSLIKTYRKNGVVATITRC